MTPTPASQPEWQRGRARGGALLLVAFGLFVAPAVSGCAGQAADPTWTHAPVAVTPAAPACDATTAQTAAWAARPDYVRADARTEAAYAYALEAPEILQWMPCYCGCGGIGHGSNLDCYFEPNAGGTIVFEEHASYCAICVDITLRTKQLANSGATLASIRTAIDTEFGGAGPGTDTARPL